MAAKRKATEAFATKKSDQRAVKKSAVQHVSAFAAAKARLAAKATQQVELAPTEEQEVARPSSPVPEVAEVISKPVKAFAATKEPVPQLSLPEPTHAADNLDVAPLSSTILNVEAAKDGSIEVSIPHNSYATVLGEYDLEILSGSASIYGAGLHPRSGPQRIYACSTHALPRIQAMAADTIVRLSPVKAQVASLAELSTLFRHIGAPSSEESSFLLLNAREEQKLPRLPFTLDTSREYQTILSRLAMKCEAGEQKLCVACIGGKSSGKSTFARHVCNKLLTRTSAKSCYFLDIDPGQPEFGPPGQVYLVEVKAPVLGPPYTHFAARQSLSYRLVAAHSIAATTFRETPQHYMDCVRALFDHRQLQAARAAGVPLVINTCGWVVDLGARVLTDVLERGVTDAVIIDNVDPIISVTATSRCQAVHELAKPSSRPSPRNPGELRQMQAMAYFHSRPTGPPDQAAWTSRPISQWRPWNVSFAALDGIAAIASYGQTVRPEFLTEVLDGALVALVTTEEDLGDGHMQRTLEGLPYLQSHRRLDPRFSEYHGLALVRGIDVEAQRLQLLTPLDEQDISRLLQKQVVLVRGGFDSPDWAYLEDLQQADGHQSDTHPWVAQREMVGIEGAVWRLRHPPTAPRHVRG